MKTAVSRFNALGENPDAALRRILSHWGVQYVRLIPSDVRALPTVFFRARFERVYWNFLSLGV
jgi:hypothetical protein